MGGFPGPAGVKYRTNLLGSNRTNLYKRGPGWGVGLRVSKDIGVVSRRPHGGTVPSGQSVSRGATGVPAMVTVAPLDCVLGWVS